MKTFRKITYFSNNAGIFCTVLAVQSRIPHHSPYIFYIRAMFHTTKRLLLQDLVFRLGSSVNSTWKKEGKNENKNSMTYLSVNSVNGSDIEIINTISLLPFFQLVKTPRKHLRKQKFF